MSAIRELPELPFGLIILRACPQGIELVGDWPTWVRFPVEGVMGIPLMVDGELADAPLWQGFAWDRRAGFIEVRAHDRRARYRVIDVLDRHLACRLEEVGS